jgi:hypothetical protein
VASFREKVHTAPPPEWARNVRFRDGASHFRTPGVPHAIPDYVHPMTTPTSRVPELAGLCSYAEAARVGFSVDESVRRLLRLHWTAKRLMDVALAHLPGTPEWEVKCGLALHQWQNGEHAEAIRARITEMRSPPPRLDAPPDRALDAFLEELLRAEGTVELVAGLYGVAHPALAEACRQYLEVANPLVDHPTRRVLRFVLLEQEEAVKWGARALAALVEADRSAGEAAAAWQRHLLAYLDAAGGIAGGARDPGGTLPAARATAPFVADPTPRRDDRFQGVHEFDFPPQVVYNMPGVPADERNLALLCRRALEMDVPEVMASFLAERPGRPWGFYRDYARQLWDEARHAMMGTVGLAHRGVDWTRLPLHVGFSLRLNRHAGPLDRQILLYAIEQSLMAGDTGKRYEFETAQEAGDALSAHFHDFDWADEVLHAQIGRRWLKEEGIGVKDALARGQEIHERTWAALPHHHRPGPTEPWDWWRALVREVLGKESQATPPEEGPPGIVAESG